MTGDAENFNIDKFATPELEDAILKIIRSEQSEKDKLKDFRILFHLQALVIVRAFGILSHDMNSSMSNEIYQAETLPKYRQMLKDAENETPGQLIEPVEGEPDADPEAKAKREEG